MFRKKLKTCLGQNRARKCLSRLLVLALALPMGACASKEYVSKPEIIKVKVPVFLLQETQAPSGSVDTNADLVELLFEYREALKLCNADKAEIEKLQKD